MSRRIVLCTKLALATSAVVLLHASAWGGPGRVIRLHEAREHVLPEQQDFELVALDHERLYVSKAPVGTFKDLEHLWFKTAPDGAVSLHIQFSPAGAKALNHLSRVYLKKRLAMYVNDHLVMAPRMMEPLEGAEIVMSLPSVESAKTLAQELAMPFAPQPPTPEEVQQHHAIRALLEAGELEPSDTMTPDERATYDQLREQLKRRGKP